jgi:hypothetical protein
VIDSSEKRRIRFRNLAIDDGDRFVSFKQYLILGGSLCSICMVVIIAVTPFNYGSLVVIGILVGAFLAGALAVCSTQQEVKEIYMDTKAMVFVTVTGKAKTVSLEQLAEVRVVRSLFRGDELVIILKDQSWIRVGRSFEKPMDLLKGVSQAVSVSADVEAWARRCRGSELKGPIGSGPSGNDEKSQ